MGISTDSSFTYFSGNCSNRKVIRDCTPISSDFTPRSDNYNNTFSTDFSPEFARLSADNTLFSSGDVYSDITFNYGTSQSSPVVNVGLTAVKPLANSLHSNFFNSLADSTCSMSSSEAVTSTQDFSPRRMQRSCMKRSRLGDMEELKNTGVMPNSKLSKHRSDSQYNYGGDADGKAGLDSSMMSCVVSSHSSSNFYEGGVHYAAEMNRESDDDSDDDSGESEYSGYSR